MRLLNPLLLSCAVTLANAGPSKPEICESVIQRDLDMEYDRKL